MIPAVLDVIFFLQVLVEICLWILDIIVLLINLLVLLEITLSSLYLYPCLQYLYSCKGEGQVNSESQIIW